MKHIEKFYKWFHYKPKTFAIVWLFLPVVAMALEKIGDVSGKIRGDAYGYYIIKYVADAQEGDIALDEVKDTIESSLLSTKQNDTYTSAQQSWVDAADFKLDLNALKN